VDKPSAICPACSKGALVGWGSWAENGEVTWAVWSCRHEWGTGEAPSRPTRDPVSGGGTDWRGGNYGRLFARTSFRRFWAGQLVSNLGDWIYGLAVATALTGRLSGTDLARNVALVLGLQFGAAAIVGLLLAGPIIDRYDRRKVMVLADIASGVAVATLLIGGRPSILHLIVVAVCLGSLGAIFNPSLSAALPNVVEEGEIVRANAVLGGTHHIAIMLGPAIGTALVAALGAQAAFGVNAASFLVSALLLYRVRWRSRTPVSHDRVSLAGLLRDLRDGARFVVRSRFTSAILMVMCAVVAVAGAQGTVQIVFARDVLTSPGAGHAARAVALGTLTAAWGTGMLIGSLASPAVIRRLPRERVIPLAVAVAGTSVIVASGLTSLWTVAAVWVIAGTMCGCTNISYETLLQQRTQDNFRGRVIATVEAAQEGSYVLGIGLIGLLGFGDPRLSLATVGVAFTVVGILALFLLQPVTMAPAGARAGS
jgi:MFS family permease